MGIEMAMKSVWSWASAMVKAIPLAVPTKIDKKDPAHVGQAINNPVAAPTVLIPLPFLEIVKALTARAIFNPTRYDTITCKTKLTGITCNPTCSVM